MVNTMQIQEATMNRRLKARIVEVFGTQADFAKSMGLHDSRVSTVVRRRWDLSDEEQKQWAAALGCSPSDIFHERPQ